MSAPATSSPRRDGFLHPTPAEVALAREGIDLLKRTNASRPASPPLRQAAGAMTTDRPRKGGDL